MTPAERSDHAILNGSRKKRVAKGSGTSVQEVNRLIKQFLTARNMLKSLAGGKPGKPGKLGKLKKRGKLIRALQSPWSGCLIIVGMTVQGVFLVINPV